MTGPLRVSIIGANPNRSWAKDSHIPALRSLENLQLAAVATTSRASADAAAAAFGVRAAYDDPRALITASDIDIVSVCRPYSRPSQWGGSRPVGAVFTAIASDPSGWGRWLPGFSTASKWVSEPPHGVGGRRTMRAFGSSFEETVLAWNVNEEFAFRVDVCSLPAVRGLAERWRMRAQWAVVPPS